MSNFNCYKKCFNLLGTICEPAILKWDIMCIICSPSLGRRNSATMVRFGNCPHHSCIDGAILLVCLIALQLLEDEALPLRQTAWYKKQDVAFSDFLVFVRKAIWAGRYFDNSASDVDRFELSRSEMEDLLNHLSGVT